jgi:hypothetical protein
MVGGFIWPEADIRTQAMSMYNSLMTAPIPHLTIVRTVTLSIFKSETSRTPFGETPYCGQLGRFPQSMISPDEVKLRLRSSKPVEEAQ